MKPPKQPYRKPALSHTAQVELLAERGMLFADKARAQFYLQHISYYRLRAYWISFENPKHRNQFHPDTHFEEVLARYVFDREFRLLLMDAIERVEVSIRSQWTYHFAHSEGAHGYIHADSRLSKSHARKCKDTLKREIDRSHEIFIQHIKTRYAEDFPPIWAVSEIMSLGTLSQWVKNLTPPRVKRAIATTYGLSADLLDSWLQHLTHIRNLCAHHCRLWNRQLTITPQAPKTQPAILVEIFQKGSRNIYNTILILLYFLDRIAPQHTWRERMHALLTTSKIPTHFMGFPADWESHLLWHHPDSQNTSEMPK